MQRRSYDPDATTEAILVIHRHKGTLGKRRPRQYYDWCWASLVLVPLSADQARSAQRAKPRLKNSSRLSGASSSITSRSRKYRARSVLRNASIFERKSTRDRRGETK